jgi:hypothetical protein
MHYRFQGRVDFISYLQSVTLLNFEGLLVRYSCRVTYTSAYLRYLNSFGYRRAKVAERHGSLTVFCDRREYNSESLHDHGAAYSAM